MNRDDFQSLSRLRVAEATVLLQNGCYPGAYYLLGYAVECALKACVARQIKSCEWPERDFSHKIYTHSLESLLGLSGLEDEFERELKGNGALNDNWAVVKDWKEDRRYSHSISQLEAEDLHSAVMDAGNGVLTWLKKRW